jgi:DNA invertase Pin-like site-specific DNA recombinase
MTTTTFALILAALLLPLLILLWATESRPQRARRLRSYGWTQQRIADHLGCSRTTVRRALAA